MKKWMMILATCLLVACTTETYDSGDGSYSYLRADFAEMHTNGAKQVDYAVSDADRHITFARPFTVGWATSPDTLYRVLLYYNDQPNGAEPLAVTPVYVRSPKDKDNATNQATDPVGFESIWQSENGRWLNLSILVKTGQPDDEKALQQIDIMSDTDEDSLLHLTLLHDQGAVPQYYTARVYVSVPLGDAVQLPLRLTMNTYDGPLTRLVDGQDR